MTLCFVNAKISPIYLTILSLTLTSVVMKVAKIILYLNFFFQDDLEEDGVEVSCFIFSTELDKHKNQLFLKGLFAWPNAEIPLILTNNFRATA